MSPRLYYQQHINDPDVTKYREEGYWAWQHDARMPNPHPEFTVAWIAWGKGWLQAREENK